MVKTHHYITYTLFFSLVFALGIVAFIFCIIAEFRKSKVEDVKLDGRLCELQGSDAFGFGIGALICSFMALILGNLIIFVRLCADSGERKSSCQAKRPNIANLLLLVSWINFGMSVVLISTATSMNRSQPYGKGWLNGECYLVKDGVFVGSAILVLVSVGCTLASAVVMFRKKFQVPTDEKTKQSAFSSGLK